MDYAEYVSQKQDIAIAKATGLHARVGDNSGLSPQAMRQVANLDAQQQYYQKPGIQSTTVIDESYPPNHPMRKRQVIQTFGGTGYGG